MLHVLEATIGGTKRHVLDLLAGFAERDDIQVELVCPEVRQDHGGDTSFVADARALGVTVHLVPIRRSIDPRSDLPALLRLTRLIRRGRYDVVHLHSSKAGALGRAAAWLAGRAAPAGLPKIVYTPNGWSFLIPGSRAKSLLYTTVERLLGRITDRLVLVSEDEGGEALSRGIVPVERTRVVHSGVALERLPEISAGDVKREEQGWGPRGSSTVIGTVARLTPQKDPFTWLHAVARAAAQRSYLRFVWIGHGELEAEFLALARQLGLDPTGQFQYLGYRPDGRELIAALDIFTLSSRFEGLPYVLLEAMALERPVAATAGVGSRELIRDGVTGFLVPPGDDAALADRMLVLADDPALRLRLGRASRERVREGFTTSRQVAETAQVYYDALDLPSPLGQKERVAAQS